MISADDYVRMLAEAPRDKWLALSQDESRIVGIGSTMEEAVSAASTSGEEEPVLIKTPVQWELQVL